MPPNLGPRYTEAFEQVFGEVAEATGAALVPFLLEGVAAADEDLSSPTAYVPRPRGRLVCWTTSGMCLGRWLRGFAAVPTNPGRSFESMHRADLLRPYRTMMASCERPGREREVPCRRPSVAFSIRAYSAASAVFRRSVMLDVTVRLAPLTRRARARGGCTLFRFTPSALGGSGSTHQIRSAPVWPPATRKPDLRERHPVCAQAMPAPPLQLNFRLWTCDDEKEKQTGFCESDRSNLTNALPPSCRNDG